MAPAKNTFEQYSGSKTIGRFTREERLAGGLKIFSLGLLTVVVSTGALSQDITPLSNLDQSGALPASMMTASFSVQPVRRFGMEAFPSDAFLASGTLGSSSATAMPSVETAYVVIAPVAKPVEKEEVPAANPGRPVYATSAALVPMEYLQSETGLFYAAGSAAFDSRFAAEQTMRFTVAPRLEMILGFEPTAFSTSGENRSSRRGDLSEGLQMLLAKGHGARPALAAGYSRLVKGGSTTDLDIGGCAQGVLLIVSSDFGKYHMDANVFLNEQTAGPMRRAQWGQFVAASHPLTSKLSLGGEFRQFTQPFAGAHGLALMLDPTYTVRPNLVFDAGVSRGLTSTSTHWQAVAGVTYLLPRRAGHRSVR